MNLGLKKTEFLDIYEKNIKRDGAKQLLDYLLSSSSDFFTAPASTRFHNDFEGGLFCHSLNVYDCLNRYISRPESKSLFKLDATPETIAITALLHDVCKINFYKTSLRNVKNDKGAWNSVPFYEVDDQLPYGHGEKSVYIISSYMRLTREEAFAIRYHMGFSVESEARNVGKAYEMFPLCLALSIADMEATYYLEKKPNTK